MKKLGMSMVTILLAVVMLFTGMMPMESAKAAADPLPVTTVPGLTIDYIIDNLGDTLNYGLVAREYHQDNHAETSVCVDLLKKTSELPFLNTSKTYSTGKPYTLYAAVSAPNGQSLKDMQFALCTRNGSEYTILEDKIVTVETTSNVTTVGWNIPTGSALLNETLYVRQVEWRNGAYRIVNEGTNNTQHLTVTYGPKVVSSSPNSSYVGEMVCNFDNESIKFFDPKAPKPSITFGKNMDIGYYDKVYKGSSDDEKTPREYETVWVSLRNMNHVPRDDQWIPPSWMGPGFWWDVDTYQPVKVEIRYDNQTGDGAQQLDQNFEDNIYYQYDYNQRKGVFYWSVKDSTEPETYLDFTFTQETDRANQLLLSVEDFSAELGNIAGGTTQYYDKSKDPAKLLDDTAFKNTSPSIYGNSTVTGPVDANGNVVSVYNIDAYNWEMSDVTLRESIGYQNILIAPNEYVVFNIICPAKGSKTESPTRLTMLPNALDMYIYEAGKVEQATWPQNDGDPVGDTGSSDRVIFNFVYWDESENKYLPYEGIVNATSQHGGTLLAPKARVEVTRDPTNGAIIADSVFNAKGKEIHQRTLTNPSQGTWVHMVGRQVEETGYIKIEKLNSEKEPIKGAVFGVYSNKACSADKLVESKATDSNGVALFDGLEPGTYYVKEISVPEGSDYVLDTNVYTVEVTAGVTTTVGREGYLINLKNKGYLKLTKVDEADTSKALPGAVFKLYKQDGDTFNESTARLIKTFTTDAAGKINAQLEIGTYWLKEEKAPFGYAVSTPNVWPIEIEAEQTVVVETTDGSGVVTNAKLPSGTLKVTKVAAENYDTKLENAEFTIYEDEACTEEVASFKTDYFGKASIEIPVGDYWVKETVTPAGREPDTKEYPVKITEDETTFLDNNDEDNEDYFTNEKQKKSIYLMKVGGDYSNVAPLKGVKFGIYSNQSCNETDLVTTAWTDSEGIARFSIYPGHYWLKEILAAPGYNILTDVTEIWVNESDENNKLIRGNCYSNGYEGAFLNMKNDAQTGRVRLYKENEEGERLDGVQFGLYTDPNCAEESLYRTAFTEYKQGSREHGKLEIPDVPYGTYYLKEIAPLDGYQANGNIYTVVVNGNPSDVEGEKENIDGKKNIVVNKKKTTTTTIDFTVTKVWPDGEPEGEAADVSTSLRLYKGNDEVTKDASGADLSVSRNGNQYTWNNLPAEENGQPYYVMETKLDGYAVPVYSNTDTTVKDKALNGGSIINAKAVSAEIKATKLLNGAVPGEGQFSFTLTGEKVDASPKRNNASGEVEFTVGPFDAEGSYQYTLAEEIPAGAVENKLNGVTYDDTEYTVVVTVARDRATQKLVATVDYNQSTVPEFENTYATELKLGVSKKLANWDYVPAGETHAFIFTLSAAESCPDTGYSIEDGTETITFTKTSDGVNEQTEADAFALKFTAANTYEFTVSETSSCCNAVEGDQSVYKVTVKVEDDGKGKLTVTETKITKGRDSTALQAIAFENTYQVTSISITKVWDGGTTVDLTDYLTLKREKTGEETEDPTVEAAFTMVGNVYTWQNLPKYDAIGNEYVYYVVESQVPGFEVPVYMDANDNPKDVSAAYNGDKIKNTKPASGSLVVTKTLTLADESTLASDLTFTFKVEKTAGDNAGYSIDSTSKSVTFKKDEAIVSKSADFALTFTKPGTYSFTVTEEAGNMAGVTYDPAVYTVTYVVPDSLTNVTSSITKKASAAVDAETSQAQSVAFANGYTQPTTRVEIKAKKTVDGSDNIPNGYYSFELYKVVNGQMAETPIETVTNEGGSVVFPVPDIKAGTYQFIIKEVAGGDPNVNYDTTEHKVTVVVTANEDGSLATPTVTYGENNSAELPVFKNTTESVAVEVIKDWNHDGNGMTNTYPSSADVILLIDGKRPSDGRYYVELNSNNSWTWIWSDLPKYKLDDNGQKTEIRYTVQENSEYPEYAMKLEEVETSTENLYSFKLTNTYIKKDQKIEFSIPAQKKLEGGTTNEQFDFKLEARPSAPPAPMPTESAGDGSYLYKTVSASGSKAGNPVDFGTIEITAEKVMYDGVDAPYSVTYGWDIREVIPTEKNPNIVYDEGYYTVYANVAINQDGILELSEVTIYHYDKNGESTTIPYNNGSFVLPFVNKVDTQEISITKRWPANDNGQDISDKLTLHKLVNGVPSESPLTDFGPDWDENTNTYTWRGMPAKDENGQIIYVVKETAPTGYVVVYPENEQGVDQGYAKDDQIITNKLLTTSFTVKKQWSDGYDAHRNESVRVTLYKTIGTEKSWVEEVSLDTNNSWTKEWNDLPLYEKDSDDDMVLVTYSVEEAEVPGYVTNVGAMDANGTVKIINTKITDTSASITLLKTVNQLGNKTPADTTFYFEIVGGLQNNTGNQTGSNANVGTSSVLLPVNVTDGRGEKTYTFRFVQDGTYIYEIHELKPDAKNELPQQPGFTYTGKKYKVEYFVELDDAALLTVNDEKTTWYVTNENGEYVKMTAKPDSLEFINDYTLTDISVEKKWSDGETDHSKDSVQVQLYKTVGTAEKVTEGTPVTLNADKEWKHTWPNLSLRDDNGNAIVYTVDEVGTPAGYVKNAEKDLEKDALGFHFKITNTKITDTTGELIINKTVKKTGDVEPNTTDAFTFSIEQVEKPVGGEQTFDKVVRTNGESAAPVALLFPVKGTYVYKVTEVIPEKEEDRLPGYTYDNTVYTVTFNVKQDDKTAKLTADAPVWTKNGTVDANVDSADFVNEYGMTSISGTKVWNDANNQDGVRPDSITIKLLAGGQPTGKSVTLTATNADASNANVWNWTFTDLPKYTVDTTGNATPIVYTVEEVTTDADGKDLSWVQYYTGKVEENATKTGFVITNTHAPGTVNITVTKVWEDNNATNRPAITLTLYKGENVVVTDAQGEKLAPTVNDNKYTWSGLPEKENGEIIVYYVKEDAAAQGYKDPVYTNTDTTVTDKALNGGTITNTLAEGEATFDITKTLVNGAYLAEGQTKSFTFKLYEYDNAVKGAEVATTIITLPAADDSTENVLGQIKFDLKFGTHTYLLEEVKGTDADIDYDSTQYKLELTAAVNKVENPGTLGLNDFKFTTMEGKEVTSLAFSNTYKYDADGKLHLEATKAMSSDSDVQTMKAGQFTFGIFKADVQVSTGTNAENGTIVFDEISYDQDDISATYLYTVKELPGIAEDETYNYFYDDTAYNLSVSVTDGGNGNLIVTKAITKGAEAVDAIEFTNTIKNKVGHIGVMKVDKADDKKGLADAVFGVYTQVDADDKIVKTSWVGDIRTGDTGAGSLQNLPIGTYYVQESMAPRGYQLDETVYTVVVKEDETAMVNGEKVFNAKLGRLMLRKADRLNPDKALPGAVYTLYNAEACLPETKVADITTGDDGIGYLDDVAPGTYWVKETKAPVGYEVDPLPYKVVIEENPDPEKPAFVQVTDFPLRGALVISKTVVGVEETTETFLFDIELSIATADPIVGSYEATLNGVATEKVTFAASEKGAKATVSLKSGDTLAISGVRDGVTYTVTEQPNSRYDVTVNNVKANVATGTIKEGAVTVAAFQNTLKQTGFTVEKVWQGAEGGEIELTLFANGVKVEPQPEYTKEGNKYSYADLTMVDEKGQEILYTVKETAMAGYTTSYKNIAPYADKTDCAYNGGQIINQALTSFSVKKEWAGLAEGETAPAIQLTLYCNGTIVTKATPKPDAKGWYVYTDLPATVEGKAAVYTVKEEPLSGYTTTYINKGENAAVTDCAYNGSTIVNSKIPQTGDGTPLALWMTTMLLAALGLVGLKAYSRKREN